MSYPDRPMGVLHPGRLAHAHAGPRPLESGDRARRRRDPAWTRRRKRQMLPAGQSRPQLCAVPRATSRPGMKERSP